MCCHDNHIKLVKVESVRLCQNLLVLNVFHFLSLPFWYTNLLATKGVSFLFFVYVGVCVCVCVLGLVLLINKIINHNKAAMRDTDLQGKPLYAEIQFKRLA